MHLRRKRVALLIETSTTWGRGLIRGIARFAHQEAHWALTVEPRGTYEKPTLPYNWQGDGVIGRFTSHEIIASITKVQVPAINVSQISIPGSPFPKVTTNESTVGRIAAKHLYERNFRSLGYYGPPHRPHYTDHIFQSFSEEAKQYNLPLSVFQPDLYFKTSQSSHDDLTRLVPWLEQLPKPVGILTWNATGAFRVMSACELSDIAVPKSIGVLAGENDELMESISGVSMSAIDHNPDRVGWHAAAILNQVLMGQSLPCDVQHIDPSGVRLGESTSRVSSMDPIIENAVAKVRKNPKLAVSIAEIARDAGVSRRALEVRFNKVLGRSPGNEIRRIRLDHARILLATTSIPIGEVAHECGFRSTDTFSKAFASQFGSTPTIYRSRLMKGEANIGGKA